MSSETTNSKPSLPRPPWVRIVSWTGGKIRDEFCTAAKHLLSKQIEMPVLIEVPHGHAVVPPVKDGFFHIYIWSAPVDAGFRHRPRPPNQMWGFDVLVRDQMHIPCREIENSVIITDGNHDVGQVVNKNALYIFHDLINFGTNSEFAIFREIITRTVAIIRGQ